MPERAHRAPALAAAAVLGALLVVAAVYAARSGLADVYAAPAEAFVEAKRDAGEALAEAEWEAVFESLEKALALSGGDPERQSELARIYRILLEPDDIEEAEVMRIGGIAATHYKTALARRPTWPADWANLAQVMYEQFEDTSPVYHAALVHAVEFGPREPFAQRVVADIGIDSWEALSPEARAAVLDAVEAALERGSASVTALFEYEGYARRLCGNAKASHPAIKSRCDGLDLT